MSSHGPLTAVGVDVGTSALKAVLVHVGGHVTVVRSTTIPYDASGAPTRDPEVWVASARRAIAEVAAGEHVDVVGLTGQMHALVPVAAGHPVHDAMLWLDYEGSAALDQFVASHPGLDLLARTGNLPLPDFTLAKWLLLAREVPSLRRRVDALPAAKDFVRETLGEATAPTMDINEAAGTQWFDPFRLEWDPVVTVAAAIPPAALVSVTTPAQVVGTTGRGVLAGSVRVVAGTGDQHAAARALGADRPGRASLSLGTSGVLGVGARLDGLPAGWDGALHLFPTGDPGAFHVIGTIPAFAGSLRWIAGVLGIDFADLGDLALTGRPDAVRFFPYLGGSGAPHPDSNRRGELRGLSEVTSRGDLARAVVDGLANEVACLVREVRDRGIAVDDLVLSGGLTAMEPLVAAVAERLDVSVSRSVVREASAVGAALIGIDGVEPGRRSVCDREPVSVMRRVEPSPDWISERSAMLAARA